MFLKANALLEIKIIEKCNKSNKEMKKKFHLFCNEDLTNLISFAQCPLHSSTKNH
jgi:hypothetical protein